MREVGGAIERINIPAVLALNVVARALFAIDAVGWERGADAIEDQPLGIAVGHGDQVDIGFVLGLYALLKEAANQRPGLTRDACSFGGKGKGHTFRQCAHASSLRVALLRRSASRFAISLMV